MSDDLFAPTVTQPVARARPPWDLGTMLYPSAFGGALSATALGLLNGYRLGVGPLRQVTVAAAGLVAMALRVALLVALRERGNQISVTLTAAAGIAVWLVVRVVQTRPERAFRLRGGQPGALWLPGLVAAVAGGLVEGLITFAIAR